MSKVKKYTTNVNCKQILYVTILYNQCFLPLVALNVVDGCEFVNESSTVIAARQLEEQRSKVASRFSSAELDAYMAQVGLPKCNAGMHICYAILCYTILYCQIKLLNMT